MNWIELRALNKLYKDGEVKLIDTLAQSGEINYLINSLRVLDKSYNKIFALERFATIYENDYLEKYNLYEAFLLKNGLLKPQIRFEEKDIQILMDIENRMNTGELIEIRDQIIQAEETVRGVSQMFFKNEKYLEKSQALINAVKQLLHIKELADEKDQQYKYVLECDNPNCIVLCENLDFLKRPNIPRKHNIELWYAGGKNISKLDYIDTRGLPIYYSCDWDYDGLLIYKSVKEKIPKIKLLFPDGKPQEIEKTEHKSLWKKDFDLQIFENREKELISQLIKNEQWIVEESNNLVKMLQFI